MPPTLDRAGNGIRVGRVTGGPGQERVLQRRRHRVQVADPLVEQGTDVDGEGTLAARDLQEEVVEVVGEARERPVRRHRALAATTRSRWVRITRDDDVGLGAALTDLDQEGAQAGGEVQRDLPSGGLDLRDRAGGPPGQDTGQGEVGEPDVVGTDGEGDQPRLLADGLDLRGQDILDGRSPAGPVVEVQSEGS